MTSGRRTYAGESCPVDEELLAPLRKAVPHRGDVGVVGTVGYESAVGVSRQYAEQVSQDAPVEPVVGLLGQLAQPGAGVAAGRGCSGRW